MRRIAFSAAAIALLVATSATAQTQSPSGSPSAPAMQRSTAPSDSAMLVRVDVARVALGQRASKLMGAEVVNDKDERIGTIDDLVVNPNDKVTYAILSVGGFLGIGSRLVAVPFDTLKTVKEERLMLPGASKEALRELPEFKYTRT